MIAARLVGSGHGRSGIESADENDVIPERLQGLRDDRILEVFPRSLGMPPARRGAVWMPDADETSSRSARRRLQ